MELAKRRALGRGLGALIPSAYQEEKSTDSHVPLSAIQPNGLQPRQVFPQATIDELAESIRQKGILQPLLVRRITGGYELIAGERRLRAAQQLGMDHVPVTIRDCADGEMLELALVENIQRENLNPLEEARAYRRLSDDCFGRALRDDAALVHANKPAHHLHEHVDDVFDPQHRYAAVAQAGYRLDERGCLRIAESSTDLIKQKDDASA